MRSRCSHTYGFVSVAESCKARKIDYESDDYEFDGRAETGGVIIIVPL